MKRWEKAVSKEKCTFDHKVFIEEIPEAKRRKMKKREVISDSEKLQIAYRVLIEKEYQTEVAKAFRISSPWVC